MNPMMAVPFIFAPILSGLITYSALYFGFVPLFTAVQVPWTTPPILSGFLVGGVPAAILQGIVVEVALHGARYGVRSAGKRSRRFLLR